MWDILWSSLRHDNIPNQLYNITEVVREPGGCPGQMRRELCVGRPTQKKAYEEGEEKSSKQPNVYSVQAMETMRPSKQVL